MQNQRKTLSRIFFFLSTFVLWLEQASLSEAFVPSKLSTGTNRNGFGSGGVTISSGSRCLTTGGTNCIKRNNRKSTELFSFMGSDGGLFGIGTPELFTIVLIGYFVLGPSDLYKLVKEIGKFIQNFQTFASEATASLENNMESQLQLEEIRKAQRELNDAFSFRRSINTNTPSPTDQDDVAANESSYNLSTAAAAAAADGEVVTPKKKKMRRIKKKKVVVEQNAANAVEEQPVDFVANAESSSTGSSQQLANDIPSELEINDDLLQAENKAMESIFNNGDDDLELEEKDTSKLAAQIREERIARLERGQQPQQPENSDDSSVLLEQSRFQQQMSGDWNKQILANDDKLEPLAEVMNLLAVLEDEKLAADKRLQEEFKAREVNEEKFYLEKRKLLEEAAAGIQAQAYAGSISTATPSTENNSSSLGI